MANCGSHGNTWNGKKENRCLFVELIHKQQDQGGQVKANSSQFISSWNGCIHDFDSHYWQKSDYLQGQQVSAAVILDFRTLLTIAVVTFQYLMYMLDIKAFHSDLHRTYNLHDAVYNMQVVKKSLELLLNRYLRYVSDLC